jgi:hypothetical protein
MNYTSPDINAQWAERIKRIRAELHDPAYPVLTREMLQECYTAIDLLDIADPDVDYKIWELRKSTRRAISGTHAETIVCRLRERRLGGSKRSLREQWGVA